jgi:hypothetical protein
MRCDDMYLKKHNAKPTPFAGRANAVFDADRGRSTNRSRARARLRPSATTSGPSRICCATTASSATPTVAARRTRGLFPDKLSDLPEEIRTVYIAVEIRRDAFRHTRAAGVRIRTRIRNEIFDRAVRGAADSNATLRAQVIRIARLWQRELSGVGAPVPRFGVGYIDHIVPVYINAARSAELEPLVDQFAVLVENLDSVVLAVADEEPAAGIESERVDHIEFPWPIDEAELRIPNASTGLAGRRVAWLYPWAASTELLPTQPPWRKAPEAGLFPTGLTLSRKRTK